MEKRISLIYSVAIEKSRSDHTFCCVPQCNSHGGKRPELSFHRFPSTELKKKRWQTALRIGKEISNRMRVCSLHFKSTDYLPDPPGGRIRRRLKVGIVPSLNLPKDISKGCAVSKRNCLKKNAIPSLNLPRIGNENHPKTEETEAFICVICNGDHSTDQCSHVKTQETEDRTSVTENSLTTIRISNLPEETYHSDLHKLFGSFGKVDKIYIVKTSLSGKCSGLAFIHYLDHEQALRAFLLDGHTFGTKVLKVEWAKGASNG